MSALTEEEILDELLLEESEDESEPEEESELCADVEDSNSYSSAITASSEDLSENESDDDIPLATRFANRKKSKGWNCLEQAPT